MNAAGYLEAYVVVEGAIGDEREFTDPIAFHRWLLSIELYAENDGLETLVYVIEHPHAQGIECECAQFLTDHKPFRTFNAEDER